MVIQEDTPGNKKIFIDKCLIHAYVSIKKGELTNWGFHSSCHILGIQPVFPNSLEA